MEIFAQVGKAQQTNHSQQIQQNFTPNDAKITKNISQTHKDKQTNTNNAQEPSKMTKEDLKELTKKLNKEMEMLSPDIRFSYNDKVNELVVNVIDKNTDKVISKIPSEQALKIMEKMKELVGALFDKKG